jgi:hypothetical protein
MSPTAQRIFQSVMALPIAERHSLNNACLDSCSTRGMTGSQLVAYWHSAGLFDPEEVREYAGLTFAALEFEAELPEEFWLGDDS